MGMSINSKLIYGLRYTDLVDELNEDQIEELDEALDWGEIDYASPCYDSERDYWIVGYELSDGFTVSTLDSWKQELVLAEKEFVERFGVTGFVYCMPDVT